jgi:hypothetical protein
VGSKGRMSGMSPKNAARPINSWLKAFAPALTPHSPGRTRAAQASSEKLFQGPAFVGFYVQFEFWRARCLCSGIDHSGIDTNPLPISMGKKLAAASAQRYAPRMRDAPSTVVFLTCRTASR